MRVIFLSWEYPPRMVGQLSGYVHDLATQLADSKVEVNVVTYDETATGQTQEPSGVKTTRVANPVRTHIGVLTWVLTLNQEIERAATNVFYDSQHVDLIDAFDWHFVPAAVTIKNGLGIPFVYSVESLEDHRTPNATAAYNMAIKSIEWLGFFEAAKVAVKSKWMKEEVVRIYKVPEEKIHVISAEPNLRTKEVLKLYRKAAEEKP